jgi:hypothetical protein
MEIILAQSSIDVKGWCAVQPTNGLLAGYAEFVVDRA